MNASLNWCKFICRSKSYQSISADSSAVLTWESVVERVPTKTGGNCHPAMDVITRDHLGRTNTAVTVIKRPLL